jgi:hypothetical protein
MGFGAAWQGQVGRRSASERGWQGTMEDIRGHEGYWVRSCGSYLRSCRCVQIAKILVGDAEVVGDLLGLVAERSGVAAHGLAYRG